MDQRVRRVACEEIAGLGGDQNLWAFERLSRSLRGWMEFKCGLFVYHSGTDDGVLTCGSSALSGSGVLIDGALQYY